MGRKARLVFLFIIFIPSTLYAREKFEHVIVFPGGSINPALFIGLYDAAVDSGWKPDVIVSTCGGSISAAITYAIPDPVKRKEYLESFEFYSLVNSIKINQIATSKERMDKYLELIFGVNGTIPTIFDVGTILVPEDFESGRLQKGFESSAPRLVMVGSKALVGPDDVGKKVDNRKLFQEIFLTDRDTGVLLSGFKSKIAEQFPGSYVDENTLVISDYSIARATRISITDPYQTEPVKIDDIYYFGGVIDLFPIEVAFALGKQVLMPYPDELWNNGVNVVRNAFNFEINTRVKNVAESWSSYWADFSTVHGDWESFGFTPVVKYDFDITGIEFISIFPVPHINITPYLESNIPEPDVNHPDTVPGEFIKKIRAQYEYGYKRGLEAFETSLFNEKGHIQVPLH